MNGSNVVDYIVGFFVCATNVKISKILDRFVGCVDVKQPVSEFELDVGLRHCLPMVKVIAVKVDLVKQEEDHLWDGLGRDLVQDLELDLEQDLDLDLELNLDLDLERNLGLDLERNLGLDLERN